MEYSINLRETIVDLRTPIVMGILNVTPDSFYEDSRFLEKDLIRKRIEQIIKEGAKIIDVGGYSSRPNSYNISIKEERKRLKLVLDILKEYRSDIFISIDTFRSEIVNWSYEFYGIDIVNDISGGQIDSKMFDTISKTKIPYIMMHMKGTPQTMTNMTNYSKGVVLEVIDYFIQRINMVNSLGIHDVIIDPGFGFSKTIEQNYELLSSIDDFANIIQKPILVGFSRKSMIYKINGTTPFEALNGTTVLNTYSLTKGISILRVHDVKEAVEAIKIHSFIKKYENIESTKNKYILNI